jgi:hypothetical protein
MGSLARETDECRRARDLATLIESVQRNLSRKPPALHEKTALTAPFGSSTLPYWVVAQEVSSLLDGKWRGQESLTSSRLLA